MLKAAAKTHEGLVRSHNEDAFVCDLKIGLFAVIDGMGGEAAGEIAADILRETLLMVTPPKTAINQANNEIIEKGQADPQLKGMGCVCTVAKIDGENVELSHVGDTRAYLASVTGCEQLTRDHTAIAAAQDNLGLTEEQALKLGKKHAVTRDVGRKAHEDESWIEVSNTVIVDNDILMLCSDGLHDLVQHKELMLLLFNARKTNKEPKDIVEQFLDLALDRGGKDNVTIVVVKKTPDVKAQNIKRKDLTRKDQVKKISTEPKKVEPKKKPIAKKTSELSNILFGFFLGIVIGVISGILVSQIFKPEEPFPIIDTLDKDITEGNFYAYELECIDCTTNVKGEVVINGLSLEEGSWSVEMEPGSKLVINQAWIRDMSLNIKMGERSQIVFQGSMCKFKNITVNGVPGTTIKIQESNIILDEEPEVKDTLFSGYSLQNRMPVVEEEI